MLLTMVDEVKREVEAANPEIEDIETKKISRVWVVPIVALVVGGFVLWQSIAEQGPLVSIRFSQGHGITAGKTEVRYANVAVGLVESVYLSEDLRDVVVEARLEPFMADFIGDTTTFWIVKADLRGASISGLNTLLSGAYIEAGWDGPAKQKRRDFDGLDMRPLTPPGTAGRHFQVQAPNAGSVTVGSPVYYRDLPVGQIEAVEMAEGFAAVDYTVFVEAPYDQLLNETTRFWNTSGISVNAGFDGLTVQFASLESLFAGGVAFGNIGRVDGPNTAAFREPLTLYPSRIAAIEAGYEVPEGEGYLLMAEFDQSIRGLEAGAPVEWEGLIVGRVRDVIYEVDETVTENGRGIYAVLEMQPARIGLQSESEEVLQESLSEWVASGMRAQLASGNLLSGRKLIRLVDFAVAPDQDAGIDFDGIPYPRLPTIPSANIGAITSNVEQLAANLAQLPMDQLLASVIRLVNNADAIVGAPQMTEFPEQLRNTLESLSSAAGHIDSASESLPALIEGLAEVVVLGERTLAGMSPDSELYVELAGAMSEVRHATHTLGNLLDTLENKPNALILGR